MVHHSGIGSGYCVFHRKGQHFFFSIIILSELFSTEKYVKKLLKSQFFVKTPIPWKKYENTKIGLRKILGRIHSSNSINRSFYSEQILLIYITFNFFINICEMDFGNVLIQGNIAFNDTIFLKVRRIRFTQHFYFVVRMSHTKLTQFLPMF